MAEMALPELVRRRAARGLDTFCRRRDAGLPHGQIRLESEFRGDTVTLIERRIPWQPGTEGQPWTRTPIARFKYDVKGARWTLYWPDRDSRWHLDDEIQPAPDLAPLLMRVDRDPTGIYWG
jgi:Protein of unknown function (DUF3024)